ncbi:MAG TPA: TIGR02265 family protein [Archangium sp.]|jgi:uncharacterized protein (TIGR02265 family)|nr:TIGR02265 family protein [Archangium sp.]
MPSDKSELAQRIAICKPEDTVRGFIFKAVYGLVEQRAGSAGMDRMLQQLRVSKMPVDFFSYPAADFLRLLYAATDVLEPHYPSLQDTFRACGASTVTGFFNSYVGNTLMKLIGMGDPKRALSTVGTVYSTLVSYGERDFQDLGANQCLITFRKDMQPVPFHEGSLTEVLRVLSGNTRGKVTGTAVSLDHAKYVLEWS